MYVVFTYLLNDHLPACLKDTGSRVSLEDALRSAMAKSKGVQIANLLGGVKLLSEVTVTTITHRWWMSNRRTSAACFNLYLEK